MRIKYCRKWVKIIEKKQKMRKKIQEMGINRMCVGVTTLIPIVIVGIHCNLNNCWLLRYQFWLSPRPGPNDSGNNKEMYLKLDVPASLCKTKHSNRIPSRISGFLASVYCVPWTLWTFKIFWLHGNRKIKLYKHQK